LEWLPVMNFLHLPAALVSLEPAKNAAAFSLLHSSSLLDDIADRAGAYGAAAFADGET
jgi:hypothetical protein